MTRRTTSAALAAALLGLLVLTAPPATAKGPNQVEVHNEQTGTTTLLAEDRNETWALLQLVEWPSSATEPRPVASGRLRLVATLEWRMPDGMSVWTDRVYSNGAGRAFVQREDRLSSPATTRWGRVKAGFAFHGVLDSLEDEEQPTTSAAEPATVSPSTGSRSSEDSGRDAASFGWGAGAGLLAAGLLVAGRRLRAR